MSLRINVTKKYPEIFTISLSGSIDSETSAQLDKTVSKIFDSSPKGIILNMEKVNYISSMGVGVIFRTKKSIENIGGTLAITNLQPQIKKVFDAVKFIPSHIFENMAEANAHFDNFFTHLQRQESEE